MKRRIKVVPTIVGGAMALECDVLEALPHPQIEWFMDDVLIVEDTSQSVLYLEKGQYLFIKRLTAEQRMRSYHCEVINVLSNRRERAPTTYMLSGTLPLNSLMIYRHIQLIVIHLGETSKYTLPATIVSQENRPATVVINCIHPNGGSFVSNGLTIYLSGLSESATIRCSISGGNLDPEPYVELPVLIKRKYSCN